MYKVYLLNVKFDMMDKTIRELSQKIEKFQSCCL